LRTTGRRGSLLFSSSSSWVISSSRQSHERLAGWKYPEGC
jgi:hypothetical protein